MLKPYAQASEIQRVRHVLQSDMELNDLLYDNRVLMKTLYVYYRESGGFTLKSAFLLFNFDGSREMGATVGDADMDSPQSNMSPKKAGKTSPMAAARQQLNVIAGKKPGVNILVPKLTLSRIFLFSQMTIINEMISYDKY
jgi:hypothetical protein